jgi:hypothetical protein
MTKSEAHEILDRIKNGLWQPDKTVNEALVVTGDLRKFGKPLRFDGVVYVKYRPRAIYGKAAHERANGNFQESGARRSSED